MNIIILNFLIGGISLAFSSYVFDKYPEKISSILIGVPIGSIYYLLTKSDKNPIKYLYNSMILLIHNFLLYMILYILIYNKVNIYVSIFISIIIYVVMLLIYFYKRPK